ncbi:chemotaxis response regulator protein-glutamate methylesterase [Bacillus timonensis]|nr:chemotaxis response regulator protein-glutamate methylesterase [Bacillus timonensis]
MKKIKVLVIDDSAFMRKLITDFIEQDPRMEVVSTARNGQEGILKVKELHPDVVTLDVEMPVMNGIEALEIIMNDSPVPVVMLSSTTKIGSENTIHAMQLGAIDFITKPSGAISLDLYKIKDDLINKIYNASKANIHAIKNSQTIFKNPIIHDEKCSKMVLGPSRKSKNKIICIGTSTGGPRALQQVLTRIPASINAPIVIVQHMPPGFTKSLAMRLDSMCEITVKEAINGEIIQNGVAYIAPGGFHLKVKKVGLGTLTLCIEDSIVRNGHRPSVDTLFESVSLLKEFEKVAVIMTGMGSDGTVGVKSLKKSGQTICIAESKDTSIVYGMPKSVIDTNLVDQVLKLDEIANGIMKYI